MMSRQTPRRGVAGLLSGVDGSLYSRSLPGTTNTARQQTASTKQAVLVEIRHVQQMRGCHAFSADEAKGRGPL